MLVEKIAEVRQTSEIDHCIKYECAARAQGSTSRVKTKKAAAELVRLRVRNCQAKVVQIAVAELEGLRFGKSSTLSANGFTTAI